MNGLFPLIKAEVAFCPPKGLTKMMEVAQLVENREIIRGDANLSEFSDGKYPAQAVASAKTGANYVAGENKGNTVFSIRTITLRSSSVAEFHKEGTSKRFPMQSFKLEKKRAYALGLNYLGTMKVRGKLQDEDVQELPFKAKEFCKALEVQLKDWTVKENFLPLQLGGVDIILGM
ncbi:transposon Tf2-1 polyprotein isoform X1 [Cucumis melo var. makuwa]|uniref:Transposon Tf2-1 polyprotein isoform X1 n=1 Tax=Cucumis melo var. makuwa TaxID=1194695 RepID=A0A5A7SN02_CUCMM|nr:transposon Tf2-1 polyprotein isoform X1 [Cucumis melo var. makuwa]TYK09621.1 transposon Tf2-1 polyprotein isoform X1 [Cucumis melo var. makuwa]